MDKNMIQTNFFINTLVIQEFVFGILKISNLNKSFFIILDFFRCLPDVNLKRLTSADIDCIFDLWPLNDVYTRDDIRCPVEQNVAFGLYHKRSNEPLAWVMQTHYGAIGMLYTKENVRRNGYARTLIKVMVKELTKNSVLPYATIIATNAKSISLFHSMGFRQISPMRYVAVCKN